MDIYVLFDVGSSSHIIIPVRLPLHAKLYYCMVDDWKNYSMIADCAFRNCFCCHVTDREV